MSSGVSSGVWDGVVGQGRAIAQLRSALDTGPVHAYLFVGPPGSTKLEAARAFAARLLTGSDAADGRDARLILRGEHPDVREVRRTGAAISAEQAREIVRVASLAPSESNRKVMILDEFHLLRPEGAALMLKTIEEPPESTTFVILCDFVPHELITIASRCARIDFRAIATDVIAARLLIDGVDPVAAKAAATASLGDLDRARLLATDPELVARRAAFTAVADSVDGTGATALRTAGELLALIDAAAAPLTERHAAEVAELDARIKAHGERGSGKKQLEDRHKRELRRQRTDELRAGLAVIAAAYRERIVAERGDVAAAIDAVHRIHAALETLEGNPNERLLLEHLLWTLPAPG